MTRDEGSIAMGLVTKGDDGSKEGSGGDILAPPLTSLFTADHNGKGVLGHQVNLLEDQNEAHTRMN